MKQKTKAGRDLIFGIARWKRQLRQMKIFQVPEAYRRAAEELGYVFTNKGEGYENRVNRINSDVGSNSVEFDGVRD